jgi:hypothetical protein
MRIFFGRAGQSAQQISEDIHYHELKVWLLVRRE